MVARTFKVHSVPLPLEERDWGGGREMANQFARQLRCNATDAEKKLWQQLRLVGHEANLPTTHDYTRGTAGATPTPSPQGGGE